MKLNTICESADIKRKMLNSIKMGIISGENKIRDVVANNKLSLTDIANAIINQRCIGLEDYDVGSTYLEQIISRVINSSDDVPIKYLNTVRKVFGLEKLSKSELRDVIIRRKENSKK